MLELKMFLAGAGFGAVTVGLIWLFRHKIEAGLHAKLDQAHDKLDTLLGKKK